MVEDTGLEPVINLLAKQVQLPLCQSPIKLDAFYVAFAIPPHLAKWPRWQDSNLQEHYTQLLFIAVCI